MQEQMLTLAEFADAVSAQLEAEGVTPDNGQVSARVDGRTVRYYMSLGLVDRPSSRRGRVAMFGQRQLAQAVAVKRLQAAGWPLADIQRRLAGLATADLQEVAADEPVPLSADADDWDGSSPLEAAAMAPPPVTSMRASLAERPEAALSSLQMPSPQPLPAAVPLSGVALPGGAVLLLPAGAGGLTPEDAAALARAARSLLTEAAARGLLLGARNDDNDERK